MLTVTHERIQQSDSESIQRQRICKCTAKPEIVPKPERRAIYIIAKTKLQISDMGTEKRKSLKIKCGDLGATGGVQG